LKINYWNKLIENDEITLEQVKIESLDEKVLNAKLSVESLPMIIVRDEKKYVFKGLESVNKGDVILSLFPKA
jgi:hypothetical protein